MQARCGVISPVISAVGRLRKEDHKFKVRPGLHQDTLSQKQTNKEECSKESLEYQTATFKERLLEKELGSSFSALTSPPFLSIP
jgi:hypothetical protein